MKQSVYCRKLEDDSGFGVFQRKVAYSVAAGHKVEDHKWEMCLGVGSTQKEAWEDYQARK